MFNTIEIIKNFYTQFSSNDNVLIVINADPDAIASSMAVKRLLWHKVASVSISNINVIKRPDNLAMIKLLGVNLLYTDDVNVNNYNRFVMVDSQPNHSESFAKYNFDAIIDHHPLTDANAPFMDIRINYGATSSIMTEYLIESQINPSPKLATALFYGIKTDTRNFERNATIDDVKAFQFLFKYANLHLAKKIEHADIRLDFLKYFKIALDTMCMKGKKIFAHLGEVQNPDVCVIIADFFMRIISVQWSIVSGVYEEKLIIIFRNDGIRKNAGKIAKTLFDQYGSAGGHKSMARAEIFLKYIDNKNVLEWITSKMEIITPKKSTPLKSIFNP
ncbi:MAG: DHH family phosphoesterase [Desulfobacterales bacterium]|nr:DHH family phosphoesterase [Desulfobacterales bacterium]